MRLCLGRRQLLQLFEQMHVRLLSGGKLRRQRRRQYHDNNHNLDALWDDSDGKR